MLAAAILLAYALSRFVQLPGWEAGFQLPGLYVSIPINVQTIVTLLVAGMTATGANWLLSDHPRLGQKNRVEHWLLPALTAWVIGLPLYQMPLGPPWWVGFALGAGLLMLVLVAEYIAVDPQDVRQPVAAAGLTAVSFALLMALAISLRFTGQRLSLILPALTLAVGLVSLRTLNLRLHGRWLFFQAAVVALVVGQMGAALYYWPLSPVSYGLILLGPAYSLTSLIAGLEEGEPLRQAIVEPAVVLGLLAAAALVLR